ncbi:DUF2089 family protein [Lactiplantibacillus plantarum]|uniref:DUF2089 family protein n=1 Tax=Lactiplantibacillus plantarum TaxID=1590 RepID=UPI003EE730D5
MDWFILLDDADQEFIKNMVIHSGSLKKLAQIYNVSYPTIRMRLNQVIQKIKLADKSQVGDFETKIMTMVINEQISLESAKEIVKDYKEFTK